MRRTTRGERRKKRGTRGSRTAARRPAVARSHEAAALQEHLVEYQEARRAEALDEHRRSGKRRRKKRGTRGSRTAARRPAVARCHEAAALQEHLVEYQEARRAEALDEHRMNGKRRGDKRGTRVSRTAAGRHTAAHCHEAAARQEHLIAYQETRRAEALDEHRRNGERRKKKRGTRGSRTAAGRPAAARCHEAAARQEHGERTLRSTARTGTSTARERTCHPRRTSCRAWTRS